MLIDQVIFWSVDSDQINKSILIKMIICGVKVDALCLDPPTY
jgi:hypothetical protein